MIGKNIIAALVLAIGLVDAGPTPSIVTSSALQNGFTGFTSTTLTYRFTNSYNGPTFHSSRRHTSHCYTSRRRRSTSRWWTSRRHSHHHHRHHRSSCHFSKNCCTSYSKSTKCCPQRVYCTTTVTKVIDNRVCILGLYPCPTNSTVVITSTISVLPTSAAVAPTSAAVAPTNACVPCTSYVTVTTRPSLVCTTMYFADLADQSASCKSANLDLIQSIAELALRSGGEVMVNGERVTFTSSSGSVSSSVGSTLITVTGQQANDAANIDTPFATIATIFGVLAAVALFM